MNNSGRGGIWIAVSIVLAYLAIWLYSVLTGQKAEFPEEG